MGVQVDGEDGAGTPVRELTAEARLRAHTLHLAEAEHRLRTSASVIVGWASTLDERWDQLAPEERRYGISVIRRVAGELADRAGGMLAAASAEMTVLDQAPTRLELHGLASSVVDGLQGLVVDRALRVRGSAPVTVLAVERPVRDVLEQLVENALKYAPPGRPVTVEVRREADVGVLEVSDEGPGLPEGVDVFEAFQRGPASVTAAVPGVGIGLHLVRTRVVLMGGTVRAANRPEGGAVLTVRLPAAR